MLNKKMLDILFRETYEIPMENILELLKKAKRARNENNKYDYNKEALTLLVTMIKDLDILFQYDYFEEFRLELDKITMLKNTVAETLKEMEFERLGSREYGLAIKKLDMKIFDIHKVKGLEPVHIPNKEELAESYIDEYIVQIEVRYDMHNPIQYLKIEQNDNEVSENIHFLNTEHIQKLKTEYDDKIGEMNNSINELREQNIELAIQLCDARKTNSRNAGRKEKFSEAEKTTILMYKIQGLSYKDIAEKFECSPATIHRIIEQKKESGEYYA